MEWEQPDQHSAGFLAVLMIDWMYLAAVFQRVDCNLALCHDGNSVALQLTCGALQAMAEWWLWGTAWHWQARLRSASIVTYRCNTVLPAI